MSLQETIIREVLDADDRRLAALASDDATALAELLDTGFHYIHANGRIDDRESLVERIASGRVRHRNLVRHEAQVRIWSATALIHGRFTMDVLHPPDFAPLHLDNRYLAVWRSDESGWRLVSQASVRNPDSTA